MIDRAALDRRQFLAVLAGAALATTALAGCAIAPMAVRPARRWVAVQKLIEGYVADRTFAGVAMALSYGGDNFAYPAAGTLAFDSAARVDENSLFRIYSMTKSVTRIAALMLVEDGKISLDQPVADVLPEFRSLRVAIDIEKGMESRPATRQMTMRHLLTNTSGLANWTPGSGGGALHALYRERGITPGNYGAGLRRLSYGPQAKNLVDMVERVAELPLAYEPGTVVHYSIGFDVMGLVIERVTGKGYDAFLRERLFGPLKMDSTGFQVAPGDVARLTTNYDASQEGMKAIDPGPTSVWLKPPTLLAGGAGLVSTAHNFARFGSMLLSEGSLDGARVMKPETARLALSDLKPADAVDPAEGVGTGTRNLLLHPFGPPGSYGGGGAAGTIWWIDPALRGNVVFMAQSMGRYTPATYPVPKQLRAAVEADLG